MQLHDDMMLLNKCLKRLTLYMKDSEKVESPTKYEIPVLRVHKLIEQADTHCKKNELYAANACINEATILCLELLNEINPNFKLKITRNGD